MLKALGLAVLIFSAAASAQITSYKTSNPSLMKGDLDRMVCQKEETIGTRLGAKKVCLTVAEWNELAKSNRETTERIQAGACQAGEGQTCLGVRGLKGQ